MQDFQFDFEKLKVYQRALDFIDKVFEVYRALVQEYKFSIGNNLIRACLSIANNLAEGNDKKSKKERKRYFGTASDSARECVSVFNVLMRQKMINVEIYSELRQDARQITSMIQGLIQSDEE
jgi:four helix bundle protein